jgi:hypothetical protein
LYGYKIENFSDKPTRYNLILFFYDNDNNIYTINTNIINNSDGYLNLIQKYDTIERLKTQVYFRFNYPKLTITDNTGTFLLDDLNHSFTIKLNEDSTFTINPDIKFTNDLKLSKKSNWYIT